MNIPLTIKGKLLDQYLIKLDKPVMIKEGELRIIIENSVSNSDEKKVDWSKMVPRVVAPFKPFSREEIYAE